MPNLESSLNLTGTVNDLSMICGYRILILIQKRSLYIIIYKISQIVYFKYSILDLTNHGHIINFTEWSTLSKALEKSKRIASTSTWLDLSRQLEKSRRVLM